MDVTSLSKSVRRITVLQKDASGRVVPAAVYTRASSKKKGTKILGPFERITRQVVDAQSKAAASYLERHRESNGKRKDGWLRDFGVNVIRASRKGSKAIKINRLLSY